MDERLRFVARVLDGEKMAALCREFDVSRKTGYKIFVRYKDCGLEGLTDRSRRPYRHANRLPFQIETLIVQLKKEHPSWGALKIREKIRRLHREPFDFIRHSQQQIGAVNDQEPRKIHAADSNHGRDMRCFARRECRPFAADYSCIA